MTGLVIASVVVNEEEKEIDNDLDQTNEADYDGVGNCGRFLKK